MFRGGANGPDIRVNLVSLCRDCHHGHHSNFDPSYAELLCTVSIREGVLTSAIERCVNFIRSQLDKDWSSERIEEEINKLPIGPVQELVRKSLRESA